MGVGRLDVNSKHRRIGKTRSCLVTPGLIADILCIPFEQWGAALIYFTGELTSLSVCVILTTGNEIVRSEHHHRSVSR